MTKLTLELIEALREEDGIDHGDHCDVYMAWSGAGKCDCGASEIWNELLDAAVKLHAAKRVLYSKDAAIDYLMERFDTELSFEFPPRSVRMARHSTIETGVLE